MTYCSYAPPLPAARCLPDKHAKEGGCFVCCQQCNYDLHICFFCGDPLTHDDKMSNGEPNTCYMSDDELEAYRAAKAKP